MIRVLNCIVANPSVAMVLLTNNCDNCKIHKMLNIFKYYLYILLILRLFESIIMSNTNDHNIQNSYTIELNILAVIITIVIMIDLNSNTKNKIKINNCKVQMFKHECERKNSFDCVLNVPRMILCHTSAAQTAKILSICFYYNKNIDNSNGMSIKICFENKINDFIFIKNVATSLILRVATEKKLCTNIHFWLVTAQQTTQNKQTKKKRKRTLMDDKLCTEHHILFSSVFLILQ